MPELSTRLTPAPRAIVRYDNAINQAIVRFSVVEFRIVLLAISKISEDAVVTDKVYLVDAGELQNFEMDRFNASKGIREAAHGLRTKTISMPEKELLERGISVDGLVADGNGYVEFSLVKMCVFRPKESRLGLVFNDAAVPFLTQLKKKYTQFCLVDLAGVRSSHAMRLYGLLMQWKSTGKYVVSVDEFRLYMGLTEETYKRYSHLKMRVIVPAVNAINAAPHGKLEGLQFEENVVGSRGRVVSLTFTFNLRSSKRPPAISLDESLSTKRSLTEEEATLSTKQIDMFVDKLTSSSGEVAAFCKWLYKYDLVPNDLFATSGANGLRNFLRKNLQDPQFVIRIHTWLELVGARLYRKKYGPMQPDNTR